MNQHEPGPIVVGVNAGGRRKDFHALVLQDGRSREQLSEYIAEELEAGHESAEPINAW